MKTDLHISFTAIAYTKSAALESKRMEDESSFADFLSSIDLPVNDKVETVDLVMNMSGLHLGNDSEILFTLNRIRLKGGKTAWRP